MLVHVVLLATGLFGALPVVWTLGASFKDWEEFYDIHPTIFPRRPTLINYRYVFKGLAGGASDGARGLSYVGVLYRNSLIVSVGSVLLTVLIASLAGYAFARLRFRGRDAIFSFFIVLMFLPAGGTLMALYALVRSLDLIDSLFGLILLYTGGGGVSLFLMRQIFLNVPSEIEDAARVDGASNVRIAFQIMFPLATSGMVLVAIMRFIGSWGEYLLARTMIRSPENMTLPIAWNSIVDLARSRAVEGGFTNYATPGMIGTALVTVVVPVIVFFVVMQKWFIRGAVEGLKL
jgi:ABC-type glycerol-3-phosphate transport system permease component